jgi:general secretion pathway protein G
MQLRQSSSRTRRAAFTLMEMLVVVAIIVALAGVGGFFLMRALSDSQKDIAKTQVRVLTDACRAYAIKHANNFPESLDLLLAADQRGGPWLEDRDALKDPWEKPYQYNKAGPRNQGKRPDIWTIDPTTQQEIGNWPDTP